MAYVCTQDTGRWTWPGAQSHKWKNSGGLTQTREAEDGLLAADTILQNLSKRPNVRSTLILSRKDGSIIRATGSIAGDKERGQRPSSVYGNVEPNRLAESIDRDAKAQQDEGNEEAKVEPTMSPAQILAESIYTFVAAAGALAGSLGKIDLLADAPSTRNEAGRVGAQKDDLTAASTASQTDSEVQLLRLRLKKQEVIIFPDPQYLCCVVQELEKPSR